MRPLRTPSSNIAFEEAGTGTPLPAYQGADGVTLTFQPDDLDELRKLAAGGLIVLHLQEQSPPPFRLTVANPPCPECSQDLEWVNEPGLLGEFWCPSCDDRP